MGNIHKTREMSSQVISTRPPTVLVKDGLVKFHTLHCGPQHIFTIQKNGTSIVSFRNKKDANKFGKLLESHFEVSKSWPYINFDETLMFKNTKDDSLKYLYLHTWKEDDLKNFCIQNYMNMLDIFRIEGEYRLVGRTVSWEAPMDFYVSRLNNKLED